MIKLKLIKTLPHLYTLFVPKERLTITTNFFSNQIYTSFRKAQILNEKSIQFSKLLQDLVIGGYTQEEKVFRPGQFSRKGDVIILWLVGYQYPLKMEFFGEDLESMYLIDEVFGRKQNNILQFIFVPINTLEQSDFAVIKVENPDSKDIGEAVFFTSGFTRATDSKFDEVLDTDFQYPQLFYAREELFERELQRLLTLGFTIKLFSKDAGEFKDKYTPYLTSRIKTGIDDLDNALERISNLNGGFVSNKYKTAVFTDREIFGTISLDRRGEVEINNSTDNFRLININRLLKSLEGEIAIGDYIVHEDYGIGIYLGIKQEEVEGRMLEYLHIKFDGSDELMVPLNQLAKITKYIGMEGAPPKLSRLGKISWNSVKDKVKKSATILASQLLKHYAKREISKAKPLPIEDSKAYIQFEKEFKYKESEDQLRSIREIHEDLSKSEPMNRLLVGDVGFGKTEVFMRAAFKIVEHGGQVAVLSPTTILTAQHYAVFRERFKNFPIRIEYLSRFNTERENKKIIDELNLGKVDIVIGTHRLLSNDVKFKNLQLLVVDEEQRFGVKQKEKIKQLNYGTHLLSVSATPIPRTLGMALSSIQDISIISQPPKDRKPIHTEILKDNFDKLAKAIEHEINRGGQIYFIHNEIQTIQAIKAKLSNLTPGIRYVVAHGQMRPAELDQIMTDFYMQKYDCLIATTIIENGIDLPNVNTIVINQSHKFGLSQLYQLRGRVGRSDKQAYCFLMYDGHEMEKLIDDKQMQVAFKKRELTYLQRLQSLVDNQDLGAGFRIASRDLEIRGAGNLLGEQQSGHIASIGYALYMQILAHEIENLRELKDDNLPIFL